MTAPMPFTHTRERSQGARSLVELVCGYVLIPRRLLLELSDNLVALGLYALVARLYLLTKAAVPLSEPDVMAYTGHCRGSIRKAFRRLVDTGWLLETKTAGGKSHYTPTWGRITGQPRAWQLGAGQLGKPRHIEALRLDERLLDTCIGSLTPVANRPARIERWVTAPLLTLRDVGAYLLALDGQRVTAPTLERFTLIHAGRPQPVPDDTTLLQIAHQATINGQAISLTDQGYRRLGLIPPMIPSMIPNGRADEPGSTAQESHETAKEVQPNRSARTQRILTQSLNPPTPQTSKDLSGGQNPNTKIKIRQEGRSNVPSGHELMGGDGTKKHGAPARSRRQTLPETPAAQLLDALNVRPICIRELATMPAELVERAIADGRTRPEVEDLAGWVVAMLRDVREHGWTIAVARRKPRSARQTVTVESIQDSIKRAKASGLFLYDDMPEEQALNADEQAHEQPVNTSICTDTCVSVHSAPEISQQEPAAISLPNLSFSAGQEDVVPPSPPNLHSADRGDGAQPGADLDAIKQELLWRAAPAQRKLIEPITLALHGQTLILACTDGRHRQVVQDTLLPLLGSVLRQVGWTQPPRLLAVVKPSSASSGS